ncbi:hypothetical protein FOL47_007906 [Perkinsus chesapeaki]|uniref:Uncharacterized protein n=1 Tax=Perkinsus chesapeaki TaxID=330153 RepID=A0A7J6LHJ7_PERCH|nr:hypothetical protein FOL47_007906 [Perkinsus chesapeaki]
MVGFDVQTATSSKLTLAIWVDGVKLYESKAMNLTSEEEHFVVESGSSRKIYKDFMNRMILKCVGVIKAGDLSWFDPNDDATSVTTVVGGNQAILIEGSCQQKS